jgi:hypothetical protein
MSKYIVYSKGDDYGACKTELVETSLKNAKQYYSYKPVDPADAPILEKYFILVDKSEEQERSDDQRFYGAA